MSQLPLCASLEYLSYGCTAITNNVTLSKVNPRAVRVKTDDIISSISIIWFISIAPVLFCNQSTHLYFQSHNTEHNRTRAHINL